MSHNPGDLDIPEDNREIAIHLRNIRVDLYNLTRRVSELEGAIQTDRQSRGKSFEDRAWGLIGAVVGGILIFVLTKGLGQVP